MPTQAETDAIYKRKPRAPYVMAEFGNQTQEAVWCTFGEEQIDLNMETEEGKRFLEENLRWLARHGASLIRLDAFAYAVKRPGTSCFLWNRISGNFLKDVRKLQLKKVPRSFRRSMNIFQSSKTGMPGLLCV